MYKSKAVIILNKAMNVLNDVDKYIIYKEQDINELKEKISGLIKKYSD